MAEEFDETPLGFMNRICKTFKAKARRLVRRLQSDPVEVLDVNERAYLELQGDLRDFYIQHDLWEQGLPHSRDDQEEEQEEDADLDRGEPLFPQEGPGVGYTPNKIKVLLQGFRSELDKVIE